VTCDDFRAAMADANGRDLKQFERWYSQAGTPLVKVEAHYNGEKNTLDLRFMQSCQATPGQAKKSPLHIPIAVGLLDHTGQGMRLFLSERYTQRSDGRNEAGQPTTIVLELTEATQNFRFTGVTEKPIPSLLRNFSAPVLLEFDYSD